jgi:hypothetical protein
MQVKEKVLIEAEITAKGRGLSGRRYCGSDCPFSYGIRCTLFNSNRIYQSGSFLRTEGCRSAGGNALKLEILRDEVAVLKAKLEKAEAELKWK